jgi:ABC-type cobalamin/Fe3+-siderophores transport system ATPase subunit
VDLLKNDVGERSSKRLITLLPLFAPISPTSHTTVSMDPNDETVMLRAKCKRFRILVVGRANAGKTTILKAICGSTENGKVRDRSSSRREVPDIKV